LYCCSKKARLEAASSFMKALTCLPFLGPVDT
jgi:hypothetical protein